MQEPHLTKYLFYDTRRIHMNKKAENFKAFLDEHEIQDFTMDIPENDTLHTVIFRSNLTINGTNIPTIFILDDSIYSMIRVFIAPNALNDKNAERLSQLINDYNLTYKSFKYFTDNDGSLILDTCLILPTDEVNGEVVYALYRNIIQHLEEAYKNIMKVIWA